MDVRFAGDCFSLAEAAEEELMLELELERLMALSPQKEAERLKEIMRLRGDKLVGALAPGKAMAAGWDDGLGAGTA